MDNSKLLIKLAYLLRLKNMQLISEEEYSKLKTYIYIKNKK